MTILDLALLTRGEVTSLVGHDRGLGARELYKLDQLDSAPESIEFIAPENLEALTPSFVQGLFAASVHRLGQEAFFKHYVFKFDKDLVEDVRVGIQRAMMSRNISGAA
jgi:hypothetical protein